MYQGIFTTALPEFKAFWDFEWIGYPEMRMDMVQTVLASHKHLHGLGLMYVNFTFFTYISLTFLYIVVGTLTLSAYRLSKTCENLHYMQKTLECYVLRLAVLGQLKPQPWSPTIQAASPMKQAQTDDNEQRKREWGPNDDCLRCRL